MFSIQYVDEHGDVIAETRITSNGKHLIGEILESADRIVPGARASVVESELAAREGD